MTDPYQQYPPHQRPPAPDPYGYGPPPSGWPGYGPPAQGQPGSYGPPPQGPPGYGPPGSGMVPYPPAGYPVYRPAPSVRPRGRAVGAIVSLFLPGVGSMINGSVGRGFLILFAYLISWVLILFAIGFILAPAVWIWGIIDGALSADRWNRARGIIS